MQANDKATIDRSALIKHSQRRYQFVDVPGVGTARIQSLTEAERSAIEYSVAYTDGDEKEQAARRLKARWIVATLVNDDGDRVFTDNDVEFVNTIDSAIVSRLIDSIWDHVGVTKDDQEALEKNLETTPDGS